VVSPFFGQNAQTMTLLVKLARKNKAKVLMAWAARLDNGKERPFCSLLPYTNLVAHAKKAARHFVFYPAIPYT
jgi:lauroyl/myristoyl acyltransferase